ncbi:hypothetical protein DFH28DRAFT_1129268 [Melampsora americana]|nr:hypothetical protein DFH28DRAFT_1129268 [Melampsora americana]
MHPHGTFPPHYPPPTTSIASSPYPNQSNIPYDPFPNSQPFNTSQYNDTAQAVAHPFNAPSSNSFNPTQYDPSHPFNTSPNQYQMNGSGIPGMSNIIDHPNPNQHPNRYQSPLPPISGHNPFQSPLPPIRGRPSLPDSFNSNQYIPPGSQSTSSATPESQRLSRFPSPESARQSMPPPEPPRSQNLKRKRRIASVQPTTQNNPDADGSETDALSDGGFTEQVADAIASPTHSPSESHQFDYDGPFDGSDRDESDDPVANSSIDHDLPPSSSFPSSIQSHEHPDITPACKDAIAKRLKLTQDEIDDLAYVYSFSNPNDREYAKLGLMARYSRQQSAPRAALLWKPDKSTCGDIRGLLHKLIITNRVHSYLGHTPRNQPPEPLSLDNIVLAQLRSKLKDASYQTRFPAGFADKRPEASKAVSKAIKEIANHVRADFRKVLLVEIESGNGNQGSRPVPDLKSLAGVIARFRRREDRRTNDTIWASADDDLRCRYALLRLIAIKHIFDVSKSKATPNSEPLPKSMWTWVDSRLSWYYKLDPPEQDQYRDLVIATDAKYFKGNQTWEEVLKHHNQLYLPDENEWDMTSAN